MRKGERDRGRMSWCVWERRVRERRGERQGWVGEARAALTLCVPCMWGYKGCPYIYRVL